MRTRGKNPTPDCILGKLFHLKKKSYLRYDLVNPKSLTGNIQVGADVIS